MKRADNEQLDRLGKSVTRAGGISEDEVDRLSSSPFLHTRLRAHIEATERDGAGQGIGWLASLMVASRAIAVLFLVTIAAATAFWVSNSKAGITAPEKQKPDDITRVVAGGTCALSSTEQCAISSEEVLATMFVDQNRKEEK